MGLDSFLVLDAIILEHAVLIVSTVSRVLSPAHKARLCPGVGRVVDDIGHNPLILGVKIVVFFAMARICLNTLFRLV